MEQPKAEPNGGVLFAHSLLMMAHSDVHSTNRIVPMAFNE